LSERESLVGEWRLLSMTAHNRRGEVVYPYGEDPFGLLMYTRSGFMTVVLMRPDRSEFRSDDPLGGTTEEIESAYRGFDAYCGTYTLHPERQEIVHHVEASKFPNWIGMTQVRSWHLESGRLLLSAPLEIGEETWDIQAVWERP
jgi:hypothetical protein